MDVTDPYFTCSRDLWDEAAASLENTGGVATVLLPTASANLHMEAFANAKVALEELNSAPQQSAVQIPENADSAHASGYHGAGTANSLSRYNKHREGFVFSDGASFRVDKCDRFQTTMDDMFQSLHGIASQVLLALERRHGLPENWFEETLGPTDTCSQWHIKRYVCKEEANGSGCDSNGGEPHILLPMHTDPSIVSVIIHDAKGVNPSALGLQYYGESEDGQRTWKDVQSHGHGVATILVGSVLSHMTGGICSCLKHRVVLQESARDRMAATLFLRPQPAAMLQVPPGPTFQEVRMKKALSFGAWYGRVSKNYSKKRESR